jgi:SAM-dependent methyltransferase
MKLSQRTLGWGQVPDEDYFRFFTAEILTALPEGATVLDAGCGRSLHPAYVPLRQRASVFWGCDPDPEARQNPALDHFVAGEFDGAKFGDRKFDLVMASYVLEHLSDPLSFFLSARSVLRPGGVFAFLTPNRKHPFCQCVRLVEGLHLKSLLRGTYGQTNDSRWRVNDYPALYRASTVQQIVGLAEKAGFSSGSLFLVSSTWQYYFPAPLRFIPRLYDRLLAERRAEGHLILVGLLRT